MQHLKDAFGSVTPGALLFAVIVFLILWWMTNWWMALILVAAVILIELLIFQAGFNYVRERINSWYTRRRA